MAARGAASFPAISQWFTLPSPAYKVSGDEGTTRHLHRGCMHTKPGLVSMWHRKKPGTVPQVLIHPATPKPGHCQRHRNSGTLAGQSSAAAVAKRCPAACTAHWHRRWRRCGLASVAVLGSLMWQSAGAQAEPAFSGPARPYPMRQAVGGVTKITRYAACACCTGCRACTWPAACCCAASCACCLVELG